MIEGLREKTVGRLAQSPLVYRALISEPAQRLLEIGVSAFTRSLRDPIDPNNINPSSETMLKKLSLIEGIGNCFLPEKERVFESRIAASLRRNLKSTTESGEDTNSVKKLKRTLNLMGERYLNKLLLDFMIGNFGIAPLRERLLTEQGQPSFHYLAMQINSECNAQPRCPGCFAAKNESKLSDETLDRVQSEAILLGSRFSIIVGGEPLLEQDKLFKLFRKYNRMPFLVATNGILLDDEYARKVAELGNVITFINIPGLESTTNKIRRNTKAWDNIRQAAESLRKYRAAAGFVSTVFRTNFEELSSKEFVKQMADFGMMLGFYFAYTDLLGCSPKTELALTPEKTDEFSRRIDDISGQSLMYLINTSGGRENLIGGCPAGRADFGYIQSDGNVGGCPMVPQLNGELNVNRHSLADILKSSYFDHIRKEQPSCLRSPELWSSYR